MAVAVAVTEVVMVLVANAAEGDRKCSSRKATAAAKPTAPRCAPRTARRFRHFASTEASALPPAPPPPAAMGAEDSWRAQAEAASIPAAAANRAMPRVLDGCILPTTTPPRILRSKVCCCCCCCCCC